jgi:DNA-binding MurR/RpiR family transcriptional regulator
MTVLQRLRDAPLTAAERRVADVVLREPETVAFGTVAEVAAAAGSGGATVMRLAEKAGYDGFSALQDAVRAELVRGVRPAAAAAKARQPIDSDPIARALAVESSNVARTIEAVDPAVLRRSVEMVMKAESVVVIAGDATDGVARDVAIHLGMVRAGVSHATGGVVGMARSASRLTSRDLLVVFDAARYEAGIVALTEAAAARRVPVIAITDSHLSPIAAVAKHSFVVADEGVGPFDSGIGALVLGNLLVAACVGAAGPKITSELDRFEDAWTILDALRDP